MSNIRITRREFGRAVLVGAVEAEPRDVALNVMVAWQFAESGKNACDGESGARYNPLNTTLETRGAMVDDFNRVGVRNYITLADGVAATIATLRQDNFQAIVAALSAEGLEADSVCRTIEATPWGTGNLVAAMESWRRDKARLDAIRIGPVKG